MNSRLGVVTLLFSLLLISCTPQQEIETTNIQTVPASEYASMPMKWNTGALPLTTYVGDFYSADLDADDIDGDGHDMFEQMMKAWNTADPDRTYFEITSKHRSQNLDYGSLDNYLDSQIGIYRSSSWFNNIGFGVLAVTSYLAADRGSYLEMIHGDIIVNHRDFTFTLDENDMGLDYDLPSIILHELGHLIGLRHATNPIIPSVMQPELGVNDKKRILYPYDISAITDLYNGNFQAVRARNPLAITAEEDKPTYVKGFIELHADGLCKHFINGELIEVHQAH